MCKICKVLATIAHAGTLSNSTSGYQDMYHFCSDLGNSGDYISEKIVSIRMGESPVREVILLFFI